MAVNHKLFVTVDHSAEAKKAGMTMRPTKLLIFGNPKAGTPLMLASPGVEVTRTGGADSPTHMVAKDRVMTCGPSGLEPRASRPSE
jgi:hypothetical protein